MDLERRRFVRAAVGSSVLGGLIAAGVVLPEALGATRNSAAFDATGVDAVFAALGAQLRQPGDGVQLIVAEVAEDGAVVPVGVVSTLAHTDRIAIVIEGNPNPLAAVFTLPVGTAAEVHTRVRMRESSAVHALVRADGRFHFVSREVKVGFSGCQG